MLELFVVINKYGYYNFNLAFVLKCLSVNNSVQEQDV